MTNLANEFNGMKGKYKNEANRERIEKNNARAWCVFNNVEFL